MRLQLLASERPCCVHKSPTPAAPRTSPALRLAPPGAAHTHPPLGLLSPPGVPPVPAGGVAKLGAPSRPALFPLHALGLGPPPRPSCSYREFEVGAVRQELASLLSSVQLLREGNPGRKIAEIQGKLVTVPLSPCAHHTRQRGPQGGPRTKTP